MFSFRSFILLCITATTLAAPSSQVHEHKGKLTPKQPGPVQGVKLSKKDENKLAAGHPVTLDTVVDPRNPEAGKSAVCIQDVDAPKAAVWNQILDFDSYNKKVPKVKKSKNYHVANKKRNQHAIRTKLVTGVVPGLSYEAYYDHTFHPHQDSLTWTLDYEKKSDYDDVSGQWHLEEAPSGKTRVYYSCDIVLNVNVPPSILNKLTKSTLKQATAWVKKHSEANPSNYKMAQKYKYPVPAN